MEIVCDATEASYSSKSIILTSTSKMASKTKDVRARGELRVLLNSASKLFLLSILGSGSAKVPSLCCCFTSHARASVITWRGTSM